MGFGPIAKSRPQVLYLGFCLPLATGKRESGHHIKENKDHILYGNAMFLLQLEGETMKLGEQSLP